MINQSRPANYLNFIPEMHPHRVRRAPVIADTTPERARGARPMVPFGVALRDDNSPASTNSPTLPDDSNQSAFPGRPRTGRPRVLVVDDLPIMRAAVRRLLELAGMTVVAETGGADDTVAALGAYTPDVVVIDLRVNRLDAVGVIRKARQSHPATQIVVHTGSSQSELLARAVEAGATGVPSRDGTPWELLRAIDRAYRTARNAAGTD
jgi:CheY-like chemotaxis protein